MKNQYQNHYFFLVALMTFKNLKKMGYFKKTRKITLKARFQVFCVFSSPEPKAHRELIGYPWIRRPSVRWRRRRPFTFSNIFSSETAWPIKAKFYVEPPGKGERKFV